jgi:hypothetical protein
VTDGESIGPKGVIEVIPAACAGCDAGGRLFRDADDAVSVTITRTDEKGHAAIPVSAGMEYLLDAVVLREVAGATTVADGPVWETLWASLTFAVPAR